jgi:imidazolonepropionase-like amidohydrolase
MVVVMAFTRALGILAYLINAVLMTPWLLNASTAIRQVAELSSAPIAIIDVTVIDIITGAHRTNVTVLIRNGRIEAIGPNISIPASATRLDGTAKFLIPGLWDMHSHHQGTGADLWI